MKISKRTKFLGLITIGAGIATVVTYAKEHIERDNVLEMLSDEISEALPDLPDVTEI